MLRVSGLWLRPVKPSALPGFPRSPLNLLGRTRSAFNCGASLNPVPLSRLYHSSRPNFSMSPVTNGIEKYGNFDLVTRAKVDYADILVSKWKSRVTGLSVVHLDYNGTSPRPSFQLGQW